MAKGCFCHFNGYEVKDAAARRDIETIKKNMTDPAIKPDAKTNTMQQPVGVDSLGKLWTRDVRGSLFALNMPGGNKAPRIYESDVSLPYEGYSLAFGDKVITADGYVYEITGKSVFGGWDTTLISAPAGNEVYYSSVSAAVADLNNKTSANALSNKTGAKAAVFRGDNGIPRIMLLSDCSESVQIDINTDSVLVLNGKTLNLTAEAAFFNVGKDVNFEVCGEVSGSTIKKENTAAALASNTIITTAGNLTVNGGTYNISGTFKQFAMAIKATSTAKKLTVQNALFQVNDSTASGGTTIRAIQSQAEKTEICCTVMECDTNSTADGLTLAGKRARVCDCTIKANTNSDTAGHRAIAVNIFASSTVHVNNCVAFGDSKGGNADVTSSYGVYNNGTVHLNGCEVSGTMAGVVNYNELYIEGGVYTGYTHGGVYFIHGAAGCGYVNDARCRCANYEGIHDPSKLGEALGDVYIGGGTNAKASNMVVHMDGCTIGRGNGGMISLRSTSGEKNDVLNISNSTIEAPATLRIDAGHAANIGMGTNITTDIITNPTLATFTGKFYRKLLPESEVTPATIDAVVAALMGA